MDQNRSEPFEFLRVAVMLGTLASLALICGYFVMSAFSDGGSAGIRSLAGVLLPFVAGGFLAIFNRRLFEKAAAVPFSVAFAIGLIFGVAVMLLIENIDSLQFAPIAEIVVASVLTLFLYAPGAMVGLSKKSNREDVWMAYYFGMVSGLLGYVVFMGFPFGSGG